MIITRISGFTFIANVFANCVTGVMLLNSITPKRFIFLPD